MRQTYLSLVLKLVKLYKKEVKEEHNEGEDKKGDTDDNDEVPLITHVNNIMHSIFSNVEVYITISKVTIQMDFMLINLKLQTFLKGPSRSIGECHIAEGMTLKQIRKMVWMHPWRIHSFQGELKCTPDPTDSCCMEDVYCIQT